MSPFGGKNLRLAAVVALALAAPAFAFVTFERLSSARPDAPLVETLGRAAEGAGAVLRDAGERLAPAHPAVPAPAATERTSASAPRAVRAPILVYHNVRPPSPARKLSAADRQYEVTPEQFDAELDLLAREGYEAVRFDELVDGIKGLRDLPEKPVVITLDDDRDSQYAYAFPSLVKHGFPATFFIFTNAVGRPGYLTWDQLAEMRDAGMEIEDHTRYHPYLTKIADDATLADEIAGSRKVLREKLGVPADYFAYPFGLYDDRVLAAVKDAEYGAARGLRHVAVQSPEDLYDLGGFIATGDIAYFEREILGSAR